MKFRECQSKTKVLVSTRKKNREILIPSHTMFSHYKVMCVPEGGGMLTLDMFVLWISKFSINK